ncbi:MAG: phospho-N-acetylmuramoyl-pentapeptide-transferase [Phycisphaerales bacterium]|nr:phospho-N-acetylmuramoyl-pentapeptide-transferase [Phycisphaerales bacterium]
MLFHLMDWLGEGRGYFYKEPWVRAVMAILVAFGVVWALGPRVIRLLVRLKIGDRPEFDHQSLNEIMRNKANTPTMGGVLIVFAILITTLLLAALDNYYVLLGIFCLLWLAALGSIDDWLKLTAGRRSGTRTGLRFWEKLVFQMALGVLLAIFVHRYGAAVMDEARWGPDLAAPYNLNFTALNVPFYKQGLTALSIPAFYLITVLVVVGTSNAVNLTDGMDGLASGCMTLTAFAFMLLAVVIGTETYARNLDFRYIQHAAELAVVCGAIVGACLGFLWYNGYPAQVFMGDTGSLPLGGLIGYVAIVTRLELWLFIVGGVFVIEALSVLIQVGYYKLSGGQRVFRCAPLHHHYHLGGLNETQVVMRFWLLAALFAAFALWTVKLR